MRKIPLLVILVLTLVGCESVVPLDRVKRQPKEQIYVYMDGKTPGKPYKVIAAFAERDGLETEARHHNNFIKKAKKLGADGIIIKPTESGGIVYGPFGGGSQAMFRATAIVYE